MVVGAPPGAEVYRNLGRPESELTDFLIIRERKRGIELVIVERSF